jgi:tetratricopeptide (TPR) repeat protein
MSARDQIALLKDALVSLPDEERAMALTGLAMQYAYAGLPLAGLDAVREAIALAQAHKLPHARAGAYAAAAMCHRSRADFLTAIACGIDAYHGYAAINHYGNMAHVLTTIAATCRDLGAVDLACEILRGCVNIAVRVDDRFLQARACNALGLTLGDMQRFDEGEAELCEARRILCEIGKTEHEPMVTANIGNMYRQRADEATDAGKLEAARGLLRRAVDFTRDALDAALNEENRFEIADKTGSLGQYHLYLGEFVTARAFADTSLAMGYELKHPRLIVDGESLLGHIEYASEKYDAAETRFRAAIDKARHAELRALQRKAHLHLADCYERMARTVDADAQRAVAEEIRMTLDAANDDAQRVVRAMWASYFSQHPLLARVPAKDAC